VSPPYRRIFQVAWPPVPAGIDGGKGCLWSQQRSQAIGDPLIGIPGEIAPGNARLVRDHHHRPALLVGVNDQRSGASTQFNLIGIA